jgi:hypothetical protein
VRIQASISIYAQAGSNLTSEQLNAAAGQIKNSIEAAWKGSFAQDGFTYTVSTDVSVTVVVRQNSIGLDQASD